MASLSDVVRGLQEGRAFERQVTRGIVEIVRSLGNNKFEHTVSGPYGGLAELDISVLRNGRWSCDGWQPL